MWLFAAVKAQTCGCRDLLYMLTQPASACPHISRSGNERKDIGMAVQRGTKGDPAPHKGFVLQVPKAERRNRASPWKCFTAHSPGKQGLRQSIKVIRHERLSLHRR